MPVKPYAALRGKGSGWCSGLEGFDFPGTDGTVVSSK